MNAVWEAVTVTGPAVMPWGKHKGTPLDKVPRDYLTWAIHNADAMRPELRLEIEKTLGLLPGSTGPPPEKPSEVKPDPDASPEEKRQIKDLKSGWSKDQARIRELEKENRELRAELAVSRKDKPTDHESFRRILKQWFGAMSRKFHPDMGGSAEKQTVLNLCYQDLTRRLGS